MSQAKPAASPRPGVSFALDRLELTDGCLVIGGRWSGVRGMRFARPALVVDGRRIRATLEHKPWSPHAKAPWIAAFPWQGDDVDVDDLALVVSPSVTVSLGSHADETLALVVVGQPAPPPRALAAVPANGLERARAAAEAERDRALAEAKQAVQEREAALASREQLKIERDQALQAREAAEAELAKALAERDEANALRDDALLAYSAIQRESLDERAQADRLRASETGSADAEADREGGVEAETETETPLGVRKMPAGRAVTPERRRWRPGRASRRSTFGLWAMRLVGTVAALSSISLFVMIVRAFTT